MMDYVIQIQEWEMIETTKAVKLLDKGTNLSEMIYFKCFFQLSRYAAQAYVVMMCPGDRASWRPGVRKLFL